MEITAVVELLAGAVGSPHLWLAAGKGAAGKLGSEAVTVVLEMLRRRAISPSESAAVDAHFHGSGNDEAAAIVGHLLELELRENRAHMERLIQLIASARGTLSGQSGDHTGDQQMRVGRDNYGSQTWVENHGGGEGDITLELSVAQVDVVAGHTSRLSATVSNLTTRPRDVTVMSTSAWRNLLAPQSVTLGVGETRDVPLSISTTAGSAVGSYTLSVHAHAAGRGRSRPVVLTVVVRAARLEVEVRRANRPGHLVATIGNQGDGADSFTLWGRWEALEGNDPTTCIAEGRTLLPGDTEVITFPARPRWPLRRAARGTIWATTAGGASSRAATVHVSTVPARLTATLASLLLIGSAGVGVGHLHQPTATRSAAPPPPGGQAPSPATIRVSSADSSDEALTVTTPCSTAASESTRAQDTRDAPGVTQTQLTSRAVGGVSVQDKGTTLLLGLTEGRLISLDATTLVPLWDTACFASAPLALPTVVSGSRVSIAVTTAAGQLNVWSKGAPAGSTPVTRTLPGAHPLRVTSTGQGSQILLTVDGRRSGTQTVHAYDRSTLAAGASAVLAAGLTRNPTTGDDGRWYAANGTDAIQVLTRSGSSVTVGQLTAPGAGGFVSLGVVNAEKGGLVERVVALGQDAFGDPVVASWSADGAPEPLTPVPPPVDQTFAVSRSGAQFLTESDHHVELVTVEPDGTVVRRPTNATADGSHMILAASEHEVVATIGHCVYDAPAVPPETAPETLTPRFCAKIPLEGVPGFVDRSDRSSPIFVTDTRGTLYRITR